VRTTYLKQEVFSKFVSKDTDAPFVRRQRAINKWLATERQNEATNDRLLLLHEDYNLLPRVSWSSFREKVLAIVTQILGDSVPLEALIGSFSGGASTSRGRTSSYPASKYLGKADSTEQALEWLHLISEEIPGWSQFWDQVDFNLVKGNMLFTVPKKTDIDRCACKEPDVNMFLQKGLGNYIRKSLRRYGVNLNDQSINRALARDGSRSGHLATLDLSSASDSISYELVQCFLPPLWFDCLRAIRCPITIIDGEEHVNEMFSSMGNGFTFELESLLFFSIARAVAYFRGISGVINVYGDDIICPVGIADDLSWVLGVLGFEVNSDKSFSSGPFRESCGGHYHNGDDITPFYVKAPIEKLTDLIHFANKLREWANDVPSLGILDPYCWDLWSYCRDLVPSQFWGGRDYASKYQLVTPHMPRRRLLPIQRRKRLGTGAYIHWLNATWVRDNAPSEGVETSWLSRPEQLFRSRPAAEAAVVASIPEFFQEVLGVEPS
jgi:hypothetical protein